MSPDENTIASVAFSPDNKFLAFGSATKGVFIYDVRTKKIVHNYVANNRWVQRVAFASDGNTLVSLINGMVYLWDASTKTLISADRPTLYVETAAN